MMTDANAAEERTKIIAWLRSKSPDSVVNFNEARRKHEPSTGEWLLKSEQFRSWTGEGQQLLWLNGIPGAGKTVIRSEVAAWCVW